MIVEICVLGEISTFKGLFKSAANVSDRSSFNVLKLGVFHFSVCRVSYEGLRTLS